MLTGMERTLKDFKKGHLGTPVQMCFLSFSGQINLKFFERKDASEGWAHKVLKLGPGPNRLTAS